MHIPHLLESLYSEKSTDKYSPMPKYVPGILRSVTHKNNQHNHIFHLYRSANDDVDESIFVAEPGTERRGVYRTMEPAWVCTINVAPKKAKEASLQGLITLDKSSQKILEDAYLSGTKLCHLDTESTTGPCIVLFNKEEKPVSVSSRILIFGEEIQRMSTPVWWFQVKKEKLRQFDWKNQVRLEAYEDFDSTLTLTDKAFPDPFTVALKGDRSHSDINEAEWQGFMYLNTIPRTGLDSLNEVKDSEIDDRNYRDLCIQGIDDFPNFKSFGQVDELQEEIEEDAERKAHLHDTI